MEAESGLADNVQEFSTPKCGEPYPSGIKTREVEIQLGQAPITHDGHVGGKFNAKDGEDQEHFRSGEAHDNHYVEISSSKKVIDFIGEFHAHPNCSLKNSTVNCTGKSNFSPELDLSLRRSHPSNFEKELTEERHTLMHSNASAFKR